VIAREDLKAWIPETLAILATDYEFGVEVSENDGKTWSELKPIGDGVHHFGGIVAMGFVEALKTGVQFVAGHLAQVSWIFASPGDRSFLDKYMCL
jgi:hypothetical protein